MRLGILPSCGPKCFLFAHDNDSDEDVCARETHSSYRLLLCLTTENLVYMRDVYLSKFFNPRSVSALRPRGVCTINFTFKVIQQRLA